MNQVNLIEEDTLAPVNWRDYWTLCKPRVVALMLITSVVGMLLAAPGLPSWQVLIYGNLGIALCAFSAAAINHVVDRRIDTLMARTQRRPIAAGRVSPKNAIVFALILGALGMWLLIAKINALTAWLSLATLMGYAVFYTLYLKRATPQNIVIGGAAGAAPPLLGWAAVTGTIDPNALLLVLIIFTWTPPHFWALAIARHKDYEKANIPMLPNTHGIPFTKLCVLLYTILLIGVTLLPVLTSMSGMIYLLISSVLNLVFLYYAIRLYRNSHWSMPTFAYSIMYLFVLFIALLIDHYVVWM